MNEDQAIEARNALDVLAVLTETRPGNVRLNALDKITRALKVLRADAQALADVRTLDDWAAPGSGHNVELASGAHYQVCYLHGWNGDEAEFSCDGATPDEARAAAAAWVREQKAGTGGTSAAPWIVSIARPLS